MNFSRALLNSAVGLIAGSFLVACAVQKENKMRPSTKATETAQTGEQDVLNVLGSSFETSERYNFQETSSIQLATRFLGGDLEVKRLGSEFGSEVLYDLKAQLILRELKSPIIGTGTVNQGQRTDKVQMLTTESAEGQEGRFSLRAKCLSKKCDRALVALFEQINSGDKVVVIKMAVIFKLNATSGLMEIYWSQPSKADNFFSGSRLSVDQAKELLAKEAKLRESAPSVSPPMPPPPAPPVPGSTDPVTPSTGAQETTPTVPPKDSPPGSEGGAFPATPQPPPAPSVTGPQPPPAPSLNAPPAAPSQGANPTSPAAPGPQSNSPFDEDSSISL